MPKFTKFIYIIIGLWLTSTLFIYAIGHSETFQILRGFWPLLSLAIAAILTLLCFIAIFINRPKHRAVWAILFMALTSMAVFKTVKGWGVWMHFQIHRSRYESIVSQVLATSTEEERKRFCSGDCWLYTSQPARVAFHYAHGFLNWHDIIFDQTGKVARPNPPYDGYLVATDHLTGAWFFCHFAD
jgi:hypothetical protein